MIGCGRVKQPGVDQGRARAAWGPQAARRARQLQGGAPPVIETISRKPCRIAQDEIRAGKVKWLIPELPKTAIDSATDALDKAFLPDA